MGRTGHYLIIFLFSVSVPVKSQDREFKYIDSLTYSYYIAGQWYDLIREAEAALKIGQDYKFLRQRLGYAYFSTGDHYSSRKHLYSALNYDSYDQFTLEYIWWSNLNTGKEDYSGDLGKAMFPELKKRLSVQNFKPVESIDFESNYKFNNSGFRTGAWYYRIGVATRLGYRVKLYQSYSDYSQKISENFTPAAAQFSINQPGYYVQINWNVSSRNVVRVASHFIRTNSGNNILKGYLLHIGFAPDLNRFFLELNGSYISYEQSKIYQPEMHLGYTFPGKSSFYLKGSVEWLLTDVNNFVNSTQAGLNLWKDAWFEGNATFGRMDFYNDFNGLYIYNSYDPVIMRTGVSFIYYISERISLWLNYSYEKKEYYNYSSSAFNQYSYLGGLKWKI